MRLRNVSNRLIVISSVALPPNRTAEVDPSDLEAWTRHSSANRELCARCLQIVPEADAGQAVPQVFETREQILERVYGMLDSDTEEQWTKTGKPNLHVLRELSGMRDVTMAERDALHERMTDGAGD